MPSVLDEVVATGQVVRGKLLVHHRSHFDQQVRLLNDRWTLEIVVRRLQATRSGQANRYYWGVVIAALSAHTGYTPDELHELLKMRFLPKRLTMAKGNGEIHGEYVLGGSTRKMTVSEFFAYVEQVRQFAAELDCYTPDPNEVDL